MSAENFWHPSLPARLITQLISLAAIHLSGRQQLARWRAIQQASPPLEITKNSKDAPPSPAMPPLKSKMINLVMMGASLSMMTFSILSLSGKGHLVPQILMDGLWCGILLNCLSPSFAVALYSIFPRRRAVRKVQGKGKASHLWIIDVSTQGETSGFTWRNESINYMSGFACAVVFLISSCYGRHELFPIACGAQILWAVGSTTMPKFRMKTMVKMQAAFYLFCLAVFGLVGYLAQPKTIPSEEPKTVHAQPSAWILVIMSVFTSFMAYVAPGAFVVANMRYEYGRVAPPPQASSPGESILIDHKAHLPYLPLHQFSIRAFFGIFGVIDGLHFAELVENPYFEPIMLYMTITPLIIGGTAIYTLIRGDFKEWWSYQEDFASEIDFIKVSEVGSDWKVIDVLDEKRPVTP